MVAIKGFAIDENGDLVIENNEISIIVGQNLTQQKVKNVLSTNKKEWFLAQDEGINQNNIIGKGITDEMIRYEIEQGLKQVDSTFEITEFQCDIDDSKRKAKVIFSAETDTGDTAGGEYTWD